MHLVAAINRIGGMENRDRTSEARELSDLKIRVMKKILA